jgi:hypothetical protein
MRDKYGHDWALGETGHPWMTGWVCRGCQKKTSTVDDSGQEPVLKEICSTAQKSMTIEEIRSEIINIIISGQGIKTSSLIPEVPPKFFQAGISGEQILAVIQDLVADGEIIEIEYTLPNMPYRTKSFLLPAKTQVRVLSSEEIATEIVVDS